MKVFGNFTAWFWVASRSFLALCTSAFALDLYSQFVSKQPHNPADFFLIVNFRASFWELAKSALTSKKYQGYTVKKS
jgi:hypothetical protein